MANEVKFHLGVKAIIRNEQGNILLLKVRTEELAGYSGPAYWDIPGGRIQWTGIIRDEKSGVIHWDKVVLDTLAREIEEETGLTGLTSVYPHSFVISNVSYPVEGGEIVALLLRSYVCTLPNTSNITLSQEHSDYAWFSPKEAGDLLKNKFPEEFCGAIRNLN